MDRRKKNVQWYVLDEKGNWYPGSYSGASLAVLMDIRDELQSLNATLNCHDTRDIPRVLRQIRAHTSRLPAKKKAP